MTEKPDIAKIDIETGEEIPSSPEDQAKVAEAMRDAILGRNGMRMKFAPEVLEQLKAEGMTIDDLLSMLAEEVNAKQ